MRLLFCCEFYYPSVGGVQEVMRQLAERMVKSGHEVTVVTTRLPSRQFQELNGVKIVEFSVSGNDANGMSGDYESYQRFVTEFDGDAILIKAAQQWTFDALIPVLNRIKPRKVLIPCGFSGLYQYEYKEYFQRMPEVLRQFDHLIFYAEQYRDIDFAKAHGLTHYAILPNGACEHEFGDDAVAGSLRQKLGIAADTFLFSTIGSLTGVKGHFEVAQAFARLKTGGRKAALVLNGNPVSSFNAGHATGAAPGGFHHVTVRVRRARLILRQHGIRRFLRVLLAQAVNRLRRIFPWTHATDYWVAKGNAEPLKQVFCTALDRPDVVALLRESDLFVFASNIEYSPLVLYESAAAGTPFLTVPVGNAIEIARWTGAGVVCPAPVDDIGFTRADPRRLAEAMAAAMAEPKLLAELGATGRRRWQQYFSWEKIAVHYERILAGAEPLNGRDGLPLDSFAVRVMGEPSPITQEKGWIAPDQ